MKLLKIFSVLCCAGMLFGCSSNPPSINAQFQGYSAKQILRSGEVALSKQNYSEATKNFEAMDALYPFAQEARQADLDIIYAYYMNDDYTSSMVAADRFIHTYPRDKDVAYAYYMKGYVELESTQNWLQKLYQSDPSDLDLKSLRSAFSSFNELVQQFPNSIYAKDGYQQMIYIRNVLAAHEIAVAQFYLDHKAYVAAINRASYVVQHLEGSPKIPNALQIMITSYQALGENEIAGDIQRVLDLNFPHVAEKKAQKH